MAARLINPAPPSPRQRAVSWGLLAVLAVIAAGVILASREPQPAVTAWLELQAAQSPAAAPAPWPEFALPAGLTAMGPGETYGPDDLYVKINGKAELYLTAGFTRLSTRRYTLAGQDGKWVELFAYTMASPRAAFAVFSQQRREGARNLELGDGAYATSNAAYAVQGPLYVEALGSSGEAQVARAAQDLATAVLAGQAGQGGGKAEINESDWLPAENRAADSLALARTSVFGFARLSDVFIARYQLPGGEAAGFVSRREGQDAAQELAQAYVDFLLANGGQKAPAPDGAPSGAVLVDMLGLYELVFTRGEVLAGVHEAGSPADAASLGSAIAARLAAATTGEAKP